MNDIQLFPQLSDMGSLLVDTGYNIVTPYVLVYGTLRKGGGNYRTYLEKYSSYVGTYRLKGFQLTGIKASYTGVPTESIVVDLLEIQPERASKTHATQNTSYRYMYEINYQLDKLEGCCTTRNGGYTATILPIIDPRDEDNILMAKLYQNFGIYKNDEATPTGDYLSPKEFVDYEFLNF